MEHPLTGRLTPEQRELARKQTELAALENELAERELELATLQGKLRSFERRYLSVVGRKYAELDEVEAQLAELHAQANPKDPAAKKACAEAREKLRQSNTAFQNDEIEPSAESFKPTENIRKLYREAAKAMHPDLASNDQERARRTKLMAEANEAYQQGDEEKLQAILREWEASPEAVKGDGPGAELIRIIRKIAQVEERLTVIKRETSALTANDLFKVMEKVEAAEKDDRRLLDEMASKIDRQISAAKTKLQRLKTGAASGRKPK